MNWNNCSANIVRFFVPQEFDFNLFKVNFLMVISACSKNIRQNSSNDSNTCNRIVVFLHFNILSILEIEHAKLENCYHQN